MLKKGFLALLFFPLMCFAQKTGKDTLLRYFNTSLEPVKKKEAVFIGIAIKDVNGWNALVYNDSIKVIMRGRYLDDDCRIREGIFFYYNDLGIRYMSGQYHQNKKTGWWQTWYPSGTIKDSVLFNNDLPQGIGVRYFASGTIESRGAYKEGKLDGDWTWYHENGQVATREKYTAGLLSSLECFDSTGKPAGFSCAIDRGPAIKGRYGGVEKFVQDSLRFPPEALKKQVEGYVAVQFTVSKTGTINEPLILESPDPLCSEEVIRVIKAIPAWYPAISHNRQIEYTFTLNIPFFTTNPLVPVTGIKAPGLY